jgi:hypothetical protein
MSMTRLGDTVTLKVETLVFRLYAHPLKQLLYLLLAVTFTSAGVVALYDPLGKGTLTTVLAYAVIVFCGLATVLLAAAFLTSVVLRRPLLQMDPWGVKGGSSVLDLHRIAWPDVSTIALYQRRLARGSSTCYLVVQARESERWPRSRQRAFPGHFDPALQNAAIVVPLDHLLVHQTPARCEALLQRIQITCGEQIERYGVRLEPHIQEL